MIKHAALACLLLFAAAPVAAQDDAPGLMEKGARQFLEGLMQEMAPALDDLQGLADSMGPALRDFAREMGPALGEILNEVKDWSRYEAPELLPNGDIIIRRKPDPEPDPHAPEPGGEGPVTDPVEL